ncbi:MAG: aldehyde dehydrogenase family protein [Bacteroidia bacterium]|nr:aldehyde dehydrogenase family protein [Bacteroidia bacterium]
MKTTISLAPNTATSEEIRQAFELQKAHKSKISALSVKERKLRVRKIYDFILQNQEEIKTALFLDFRKTEAEVILTELAPLKVEARHVMQNLRKWMQPEKVPTPPELFGSSSSIYRIPKGNVLIIGPWNYPWFLTVKPIVWAVAAGNAVIVKPSELIPHTSALMCKMVKSIFPPEEVTIFEGDHTVATSLLELPFNHIYFTGSPEKGKIVMQAAARHLASVTLELGGKSPVIIDETTDIKYVAEHIMWGKTLNNGQTCVAPDYVLIHSSRKDEFIRACKEAINTMYNAEGKGVQQSPSYCRIVNARHFERIQNLLDDALEKGAKLETGGERDASENFIAPTILSQVTEEMDIMHEEIFGPLLPIVTYNRVAEIPAIVSRRENPLVMYIFSRNQQTIDFLLGNITSGDVAINDVIINFGSKYLPVGGIGNSGIGKSGGYAGFREFTHERSVIRQVFGSFKLIFPPYEGFAGKLMRLLMKLV